MAMGPANNYLGSLSYTVIGSTFSFLRIFMYSFSTFLLKFIANPIMLLESKYHIILYPVTYMMLRMDNVHRIKIQFVEEIRHTSISLHFG